LERIGFSPSFLATARTYAYGVLIVYPPYVYVLSACGLHVQIPYAHPYVYVYASKLGVQTVITSAEAIGGNFPMAKKSIRPISQDALRSVAEKKAAIAALEAELKAAEEVVLAALKNGAKVANGLLTARLKTWERRNVAWRAIVEREQGKEYADRVLNATRPEKYEALVVEVAG